MSVHSHLIDDNNDTVIALNVLTPTTRSFKSCSLQLFSPDYAGASFTLKTNDAIADLGATQVFFMAGTPVINKRITTNPLKVSQADRRQVMSMHMCDIYIDNLPFPLTGHIIPELTIASLFGIHMFTNIGCKVTFSKHTVVVTYNGKVILTGSKDPTTDLWTLPMGTLRTSSHHANTAMTLLAAHDETNTHTRRPTNNALFTHMVRRKANSICFAHQSLCSPKISMLLKAIYQGYLKGCLYLSATGVAKYLKPSPDTAKGHMKRPQMGIRSTRCNFIPKPVASLTPIPSNFEAQSTNSLIPDFHSLHSSNANMIEDDKSIRHEHFLFLRICRQTNGNTI